MRKTKLLCIALTSSMLLCSCGRSADVTNETDTTEETVQSTAEIEGEPLTEEILEGLWVDDTGYVCYFDFDGNEFTDAYGAKYDITELNDDSFVINSRTESDPYNYNIYTIPVGTSITIDAVYSEGELHIFDTVAYHIDSDEGQEISDRTRDILAGNTLNLAVTGGYLEFDDDMTTMTAGSLYGDSESVEFEFTGSSARYNYDGKDGEMIFRLLGDDVLICMNGQIGYGTSQNIPIPGRWLYYDAAFEDLEILSFSGKSNQYYSEDPITGEISNLNEGIPEINTSAFSPEIESERGVFIGYDNMSGVFVNSEIFDQYTDFYSNNTTYLIDMRSPYACAMISRQQVITGDPGELSEYRVEFGGGYISFDVYENEWPSEYVTLHEGSDLYLSDLSTTWSAFAYSNYIYVSVDDDCGETVIHFEYDGNLPEGSYICYISDNSLIEPAQLETTYEDGYASAVIGEPGYYFLGQIEYLEVMTEENYFEIDPADSLWARNCDTGDIIGLVDMDYIEQCHNGVFVVDSVEDLASLTYYVNTYPRDGYDASFCIWVDLVDDIDLTGYEWAPLGFDDYLYGSYPFAGIFAGNGHTITGLNIVNRYSNNGFFGSIFFATVIGLNLDDAVINGATSSLMAGDCSTTSFYDCHVTGSVYNNFGEGIDLFPYIPQYGNNEYFDCSINVSNGSGSDFEEDLPDSSPDPNSRNELQDLFDPQHDGTYEYSTDYFFGDDIPEM